MIISTKVVSMPCTKLHSFFLMGSDTLDLNINSKFATRSFPCRYMHVWEEERGAGMEVERQKSETKWERY